jgi:hypothetical protein
VDSDKYPSISVQTSFPMENKDQISDIQLFNIISNSLSLASDVNANDKIFSSPSKGNFFFSFDGLSLGIH